MHNLMRICALMLAAVLVISGCGGDKKQSPETLPEPTALLEKGAAQIQEATSFSYELDVDGYPVSIQLSGPSLPIDAPLAFKYAKGVFEAPDRLYASIQFSVGDFSTTAELIALDHNHYFRGELLTGNQWINQELIQGFTPASFKAQPGGIASALETIDQIEMVGKEDLDGIDAFHLRGTITAQAVYSLTFGLIRTTEGQLTIEVYIQVSDERVIQITITEPAPSDAGDDQAPTLWKFSFADYNQDVTISAPATDEAN